MPITGIVLRLSKEFRPIVIARTETVRLSGLGAVNNYKKHQVDQVRWITAVSERTCPECSDLNGRIFDLNEANDIFPAHPMCKCSLAPVTKLEGI